MGSRRSVNDVTEVRIAKGDSTRVTLRKPPDAWHVVEREYVADSGKVRKLLLDLGALQVVEEKTSDPASYERIGVEDVKGATATGTQIEAVTPKKVYGVIAGRVLGHEVVVRASERCAEELPRLASDHADANPKQWLQKDVLDIAEAASKRSP